MQHDFALILGYETFGNVAEHIQIVKAYGLVPFVVLNESGADYSNLLPQALLLHSSNPNRNHDALVAEIKSRLDKYVGRSTGEVRAIINSQDRMWLCYLDLCRAFPAAASVPRDGILHTAIKPNLRYLLRGSELGVRYVLLPSSVLKTHEAHEYPPLRSLINEVGDLIVKPVLGMGGLAVARVHRSAHFVDDLHRALERAWSSQKEAFADSIRTEFLELGNNGLRPVNDYLLVEEYLDGRGFSMEGFAEPDGSVSYLVEQEKTKTVEVPSFRDLEYTARHPATSESHNGSCVHSLLKVIGLRNFPFHIELREAAEGVPKPIEVNPRTGGGSIVDLVSAIHSINLKHIGTSRLLDAVAAPRYYVTVVVQPPMPGRIAGYDGVERIRSQPDCAFIKKIVEEGREIKRTDMETYLIEFCVVGRDYDETRLRAAQLLEYISVNMERDGAA
jgi:hypothetical protein